MSKKKLLVMILALGTILAFGAAATAADWYVDANQSDAVDGTWAGSANTPFVSIGYALTQAADGDTIYVDDAIYDKTIETFPIDLTGAVARGVSIVFQQNGTVDDSDTGTFATIDAGGAAYALKILDDQAYTITGPFTIKGAVTADILVNPGAAAKTTTITGCSFGGDQYGIQVLTGNVTIQDNTFTGMTDAGIQLDGGTTIKITSSGNPGDATKPVGNTFTNIGTGTGARGGIVLAADIATELTVKYNHFTSNLNGFYIDDGTGDNVTALPGTFDFEFNEFEVNTTGFYNGDADADIGTVNLLIEKNWWNDPDGPSDIGPGAGDAVSKATGANDPDFTPWLGHVLWSVNLVDPANNYYNTITDALVPAVATDTIQVDLGTYALCETFPLDLDKASLTLKATGAVADTTIENAAGETVRISANNVTLGGSGFTIKGVENATTGVRLWNQAAILDGVTVKGNTFLDNQFGVYAGTNNQANDITNLTVDGNTFTRLPADKATYSVAVHCLGNSNFQLKSALITGNIVTCHHEGVSLANVLSSTISNNIISDGYWTGIAVDIWDDQDTANDVTTNVTITRNQISNIANIPTPGAKDTGIAIDRTATNTTVGSSITNITVTQNTVTNCQNDFYINRFAGVMTQAEVNTFTIRNNTFNTTGYGAYNSMPGITLDATGNYWGHYSGPDDLDENATGQGSKTTGLNVTVDPWLTSAYGTGTSTHTYYSTGVGGYHMVSTPLDLYAPGSVAQVYDELISPTLYKWNPSLPTPDYVTFTGADTVASKWGYWLYLSGDATITVEGTEAAANTEFSSTDFADAGWYQISAPYSFDWDEATGTHIQGKPLAPAELRLVSYDPETGEYGNHFKGQGYVGSAWYGYWVKAEADNATLTLKKADPSEPPSPLSMMSAQRIPAGLDMPPAPPSFVPQGAIPEVKVELAVADGVVTFAASVGEALKVQVFNIGGGLVYEASADGSELTWTMQTSSGELVANGVYLAKVTVKTAAGWVDGGLFRILVLR